LPSSELPVESASTFKTGRDLLRFSVRVRQTDGVSLVDVSGRLTSFESKAFRDMIQGLLNKGKTNIVLNLTELDY
jgi:anti-anti-sigma regulatory factor